MPVLPLVRIISIYCEFHSNPVKLRIVTGMDPVNGSSTNQWKKKEESITFSSYTLFLSTATVLCTWRSPRRWRALRRRPPSARPRPNGDTDGAFLLSPKIVAGDISQLFYEAANTTNFLLRRRAHHRFSRKDNTRDGKSIHHFEAVRAVSRFSLEADPPIPQKVGSHKLDRIDRVASEIDRFPPVNVPTFIFKLRKIEKTIVIIAC